MKAKLTRRRATLILAVMLALAAGGFWLLWPHPAKGPSLYHPPTPAATPTALSVGRAPDAPLVAPGFAIHVFADHLGTARDLEFSPGGTLLVSDPNAGTVVALPDRNHDGTADEAKVVLRAGDNPHGLAFHDGQLFVAQTSRVARYRWDEQTLTATFDRELFKLPSPNADHNKRTITFAPDGRMFVSVGSTCNVCTESDNRSATIMVANADGANPRIFASGLRNAPFMAINPTTQQLWSTEMGRDNLGDNTPPDEIDIIRDGKNYGWPICYGDRIHDTSFDRRQYFANPCASTEAPTYKVPAHNAPLGLAFINSTQFAKDQQGSLLVAYHGSWNRSVPDGYKVVRLSVSSNTITGSTDFITGFITGRTASARPVDLIFDPAGNLYLSDDKAGAVYIIQQAH
jgi:glucose/arabinose dehydrogenase